MKKIGVFLFLITLAVGLVVGNLVSFGKATSRFFNFSFHIGGIEGSGNTSSESRNVTGFHAVDVGGVFQVEITAQRDFAVEVEADDNLLPLIRTEVRNGVLKIKTEKKISTSNPMRIRISAPNIDALDISGAASVRVTELKNSRLVIDSSGASKISVEGETAELSVDVSGATKVDAESLKAGNANVEASGASQVMLHISGDLKAKASGASRITYAGTPLSVSKRTSGAGSVVAQ